MRPYNVQMPDGMVDFSFWKGLKVIEADKGDEAKALRYQLHKLGIRAQILQWLYKTKRLMAPARTNTAQLRGAGSTAPAA